MSVERSESFSYDTGSCDAGGLLVPWLGPVGSVADAAADGPHAHRVVFRPLTADPVALPEVGPGRVQWLLGEDRDLVAVALAWAMKSYGEQDCLVADALPELADGPTAESPTRVGATSVYRGHAPRLAARLRDWVLFLNRCRSSYNQTFLTPPGSQSSPPASLLQLADGVIVLSQADHESVYHAKRELNRLRQAGVRRCECLWLDAA